SPTTPLRLAGRRWEKSPADAARSAASRRRRTSSSSPDRLAAPFVRVVSTLPAATAVLLILPPAPEVWRRSATPAGPRPNANGQQFPARGAEKRYRASRRQGTHRLLAVAPGFGVWSDDEVSLGCLAGTAPVPRKIGFGAITPAPLLFRGDGRAGPHP